MFSDFFEDKRCTKEAVPALNVGKMKNMNNRTKVLVFKRKAYTKGDDTCKCSHIFCVDIND